jgi:hypothetical protein
MLDLNQLANYVKENEQQLAAAAVFGAKTASIIEASGNVQVGIKSSETINILSTDVWFQQGGSCGFTPTGVTTITQRVITVGKIKVQESICPKTFEAKYTQKALKEGSTYDYMAFATEYTALKSAKISAALETAIWQGELNNMNPSLSRFDGFLRHLDILGFNMQGSPVKGNVDNIITLTQANVITEVDRVFSLIPAALLDKQDVVMFVGNDTFREYVLALRNANYFHYAVDATNMELVIPGTNVKLIGVNGLNGTSAIFAASLSNLYIGTDMLNEQDKYELFYAKEADEMRFSVEFKLGTQIAFPDEVVYWKAD